MVYYRSATQRVWEGPVPGVYRLQHDDDEYQWTLSTAAGQILLTSARHKSEGDAVATIAAARICSVLPDRYERWESNSGYYFILKAANGAVLATSETYASRAAKNAGIRTCMLVGPVAPTVRV